MCASSGVAGQGKRRSVARTVKRLDGELSGLTDAGVGEAVPCHAALHGRRVERVNQRQPAVRLDRTLRRLAHWLRRRRLLDRRGSLGALLALAHGLFYLGARATAERA